MNDIANKKDNVIIRRSFLQGLVDSLLRNDLDSYTGTSKKKKNSSVEKKKDRKNGISLSRKYQSDDIDWNIAALCAHDAETLDILKACRDNGIDTNIKYVFGSASCKFQGGRVPFLDVPVSYMLEVIDEYNQLGVSCRATFSSYALSDADLMDGPSNEILKKLSENNEKYGADNGVILALDKLAVYIRKKYSNLELISSFVKPAIETGLGPDKDTVAYYNRLFRLYDIVVVNEAKIHDDNFLNRLKYKDRVEFIVNAKCIPNCPFAGEHYKMLKNYEEKARKQGHPDEVFNDRLCKDVYDNNSFIGSQMTHDEIDHLISIGFRHFKIEGRTRPDWIFERDLGEYIFDSVRFNKLVTCLGIEPI